MARHPSFLVFCVDQMQAACMSCAGHPDVGTPNLDRLAEEGVLFSRAYCDNPVCTPSRVSIITGLSSRQHGVYTNGSMIASDVPTVASVLNEAGYRTRACGKLHLQPWLHESSPEWNQGWRSGRVDAIPPGYFGFEGCDYVGGHVNYVYGDYLHWLSREHPGLAEDLTAPQRLAAWAYYENKGARVPDNPLTRTWRMEIPSELHYNNWIANRSIDHIRGLNDEERFFLWCSFPDPHHPFAACKPYSEMYDPGEIKLPGHWSEPTHEMPDIPRWAHGITLEDFDEPGLREMLAQTYGMVSHVDECVGRVMEALRETGRDGNTIVAFMADHGEYLGAHHLICKGMLPYEELIRVPCIWRAPGGVPEQEVSEPVSLLDFAPTVLDYAGVPVENLRPHPDQGVMPEDADRPWFDGVSLRETLESGQPPATRDLVLANEENRPFGPRPVRCRTLVTERHKLVLFAREGNNCLFDLESDPYELNNLWDDPATQDLKRRLLERYAHRAIWTEYAGRGRLAGA